MPLARILTRFPEQAGALSEQLRQHGYTVEFSSPELSGKAPADLEIDFEICAEPDALSRASALAEQLHADVAVSPGALEVLESHPAPGDDPERQAVASFASQETAPLQADAAQAREAAISLPPDLLGQGSGLQGNELEKGGLTQASSADRWHQPKVAQQELGEARPHPEPWSQLASQQCHESERAPIEDPMARASAAWDDELNIARAAGDSSEIAPQRGKESLAQLREKSAAALQSAAVAASQVLGKARTWGQGFWASLRQVTAEYREGLRVRQAEMKAEREHKLLDLEKRRVLAQERANELEAAREAAALRLQELLRDRGGLTEAQPVPPQRPASEIAAAQPDVESVERRSLFARKIRIPFTRYYRPQLEAVLMGVAAACSLFVLGLAVTSYHARPAISSSVKPASSGVTVQADGRSGVTVQAGKGSGVTVQAGKPAARSALPLRPSPVAQTQPAAKPAPGKTSARRSGESDVTVRNITKPSPHRGSGDGGDVVVRHFGAQPKPAQSPPQAGLKHISDLDN
jgi:hypothetical protein